VTASLCELQPGRKSNAQYTRILSLLQPLPGDFRSNDVTCKSLPVTCGHVTSFPVTWLPPPASYTLLKGQTQSIREFWAFYSHFQVTFGQMMSHPGSLPVTWGHVTSFPITLLPPENYSLVGSQMHSIREFWAFYSHFQVTYCQMSSLPGHFWSPEVTWVISCHVTASSCELQPFRKSNAQYTRVYGLQQPLPGKFQSNEVTSGSLPSSRDVISCHVTTSSCEIEPCRKSNPQYMRVFGLLQTLPGDFRSNDVTSGSLPLTWGHVTSFPVTSLPPPARYSLVGSQTHSICEFLDFYSHFQLTSGQMTSLPGNFRSPVVTWRHFLSRDCLLLQATAL